MLIGNAGEAVQFQFTLLDGSSDPVTGAVNGDFTKRLYKRGASDGATVTVSELGSGDYLATFTPDEAGQWDLVVRHTVNKTTFTQSVAVGLGAKAHATIVAGDGSTSLYVKMHMERNGRRVLDATSATLTVYDYSGTSVGTVTAGSDDAQGFFSGLITLSSAVVDNRPYEAVVSITDPGGTVVTNLGALAVEG